jgi:hypothetical protein
VSDEPYGVIAGFDSEEDLVAAVRRLHRQGVALETYTPYPVEAIDAILAAPPSRVPVIIFCVGILGAAGGFLLQYWGMALAYPINVGGRPLDSWPAFMPSTFELGILAAVSVGFVAYAAVTRLTTLYHPIFNAPDFERASQDQFLVCMRGHRRDDVVVLLGPIRPRLLAEVPP